MTRLCGERYQRQRVHTRYGHQQDVATLAGQKVSITRPRARQVDGGRERPLEIYAFNYDWGGLSEGRSVAYVSQ